MNKRAISPLFSTIILIGFAIALGGVVMNWGKAGYTVDTKIGDCTDTSISIVSYSDQLEICNKDNNLYFTLNNDGETDLNGIKVTILGETGIYSTILAEEIPVAGILKLDMEYENIGKTKKIIFVPQFTMLGQDRLCPKHGFSVENVGEC